MRLIDAMNPSLTLSDFHRERIARIDTHDFSDVIRKTTEDLAKQGVQCSAEWLNAGVLALKQYYAIALLDSLNMHAVSDRVDPFWHAHILHTREYARFCDDVVGGFMHHDPLDHGRVVDVNFVASVYEFTMRQFRECFVHVDERFYPPMPERCELVCLHGNDAYEAARHTLFPRVPEAQPQVAFVH